MTNNELPGRSLSIICLVADTDKMTLQAAIRAATCKQVTLVARARLQHCQFSIEANSTVTVTTSSLNCNAGGSTVGSNAIYNEVVRLPQQQFTGFQSH